MLVLNFPVGAVMIHMYSVSIPPDGDGGVVDCACFGVMSGLEIASSLTSMFLALWWLVVRNTAGYAWVLQVDTLYHTWVDTLAIV